MHFLMLQEKGRNFPTPISGVGHTLSTPCGGQSHSDQDRVCWDIEASPTLQSSLTSLPPPLPALVCLSHSDRAGRQGPGRAGPVHLLRAGFPPKSSTVACPLLSKSLFLSHSLYCRALHFHLIVGGVIRRLCHPGDREGGRTRCSPGVPKSSSDSAQWAVFSGCRMTARVIGCSSPFLFPKCLGQSRFPALVLPCLSRKGETFLYFIGRYTIDRESRTSIQALGVSLREEKAV